MVKYDLKKTQSWKLVNEDKEILALLVSARKIRSVKMLRRLDLFLREVVNVCSLLILLNKSAPRDVETMKCYGRIIVPNKCFFLL